MTEAPSAAPQRGLGLGAILAFAGPSLPLAGMGTIYGVYMAPYLTGVLGVGLTAIAGAFLIIQALTLFLDPVLGWAMDRTKTPIGRFRPWLLASTPIFLLAVYMMFMAKPGIDADHHKIQGVRDASPDAISAAGGRPRQPEIRHQITYDSESAHTVKGVLSDEATCHRSCERHKKLRCKKYVSAGLLMHAGLR